jgi:hypothetical protein
MNMSNEERLTQIQERSWSLMAEAEEVIRRGRTVAETIGQFDDDEMFGTEVEE